MPRARPAFVAVLLVVAAATTALAVGGAVSAPVEPGDDPVVATSEDSSRVLLSSRADAAGFSEPNVSVTNALAAGYADLSTEFRLGQVEQRLDAAADRQAQRRVLQNATDDIAERVDALRAREEAAREAYAAGDTTAADYVATLGTIHAEASSLSDALGSTSSPGTLYAYATDNSFSEVGTRIYQLRAQLAMVEGPVRERVASVVHGQRDEIRVHVTVGDGVMLSTIDGGQYVRESFQPDNVEDDIGGTLSDAPALIKSHYPWVPNHSTSPAIETRGGYAFHYTANYGHGQLTAYIDTTTERVYVEHHQQTLAQLPADVESEATAGNVTLSAARTYAGGPLLVRAENETGEPVDTTIQLDGAVVGDTGDDGRLWVLSPAGEYTVTTTHDGETLETDVTARPSPE